MGAVEIEKALQHCAKHVVKLPTLPQFREIARSFKPWVPEPKEKYVPNPEKRREGFAKFSELVQAMKQKNGLK